MQTQEERAKVLIVDDEKINVKALRSDGGLNAIK